ncbi:MAG: ribbon-helix-helix protein, CopG family [Polyangiaceae bacterium]|nr:ribbon-helix-helix protein, CopG family [Polyangiaceae bacterium]
MTTKTAISMPDEVYKSVNHCAKRLRISRSELVTRALKRFLDDELAIEVRESYDRAFGPEAGGDDIEELRRAATRQALLNIEW